MKVLEARERDRDLVIATHVCARWREILTSASCLWSKIDFGYPGRLACCFLKRSRETLIDVRLGEFSRTLCPAKIFTGPTPWIARIKILYIEREMEQMAETAEWLCQETPNLQSLTIKKKPSLRSRFGGAGTGRNVHFPDNFLGRHAPLLQSLTFHSVSPVKVFTFPLPKLTHLCWTSKASNIVIEELLGLFESSPLLETIRIRGRIQTHTKDPLKKVTLSELHRLEWEDTSGGSTSLIPCLVAPKLNKLEIEVAHIPQSQRTAPPPIIPPDGNHIPLLLEPVSMTYVHNHGKRAYYFIYPETTYFMFTQLDKGHRTSPATNLLLSPDFPISFSRTQELIIQAVGGALPLDAIPIGKLESLRELDLVGQVDSLVRIIGVNRGKPVPCPALWKICISPNDLRSALRELRKVLEERREAGHAVNTVEILEGYECTEVEELRTVVDEVILL